MATYQVTPPESYTFSQTAEDPLLQAIKKGVSSIQRMRKHINLNLLPGR